TPVTSTSRRWSPGRRPSTRRFSVRAAAGDDRGDRGEEALDVARQRTARPSLVVELDHVLERDVRAAGDLPRARETGAEVGAARLPGLAERGVLGQHQRARADEAHVAAQYVQQLRRL